MWRGVFVAILAASGMWAYFQNAGLAGDYAGMLGPYHVKLHLAAGANGTFTGTADNTDLQMLGMQCNNIHADGQTLSFAVPAVQGAWTGFVSADGNSLSGTWSQGTTPMPLNFTRVTAASAAAGASQQGEVKWDDYVFRFLPGGNMVQVYQGGRPVGSIITMNGQQRVIALPSTDSAKLQKSYQD